MVQITDESPPSFLTHSVASPTYPRESPIMKLKAFGTREDWQPKRWKVWGFCLLRHH